MLFLQLSSNYNWFMGNYISNLSFNLQCFLSWLSQRRILFLGPLDWRNHFGQKSKVMYITLKVDVKCRFVCFSGRQFFSLCLQKRPNIFKNNPNFLTITYPSHMWQMRHRNPSELLQTCPWIFLNCFSITNNISARKIFSIYGLLQKWFTSVFPYVMAKYRENWHFLSWELPEIVHKCS